MGRAGFADDGRRAIALATTIMAGLALGMGCGAAPEVPDAQPEAEPSAPSPRAADDEERVLQEQHARLGRWLEAQRDVDGLYAMKLWMRADWRLARLDAGPRSEMCVVEPKRGTGHCWPTAPGFAVIGHEPLDAADGTERMILWIAPEDRPAGPVTWRVLEPSTGRLCVGGELMLNAQHRPLDGAWTQPTPCPPDTAASSVPDWAQMTLPFSIGRLDSGTGVRGLNIRSAPYEQVDRRPMSLCLSGADRRWTCGGWSPPGWGGFDVGLIGVDPPVGDPPLWPVRVRQSWVGSSAEYPVEDDALLAFVRSTPDGWVTAHEPLKTGTWTRRRHVEIDSTRQIRTVELYTPSVLDARTVSLALSTAKSTEFHAHHPEGREGGEPEVTMKTTPIERPAARCCVFEGTAWRCEPRACAAAKDAGGGLSP